MQASPRLKQIPALLGALSAAVFLALSMSPNAATRFFQWPWFFYSQVLLVTPIAILAGRLLLRGRLTRFGPWLDAGLGLLAAANVAAALFSPFSPQSLNLALIPVAGICLAYLGLDWIERDPAERVRRTTLVAGIAGTAMLLFVVMSSCLWLFARVLPCWLAGSPLTAAFAIRNEDPFGHSLYTAGAAVLSAPWLAALGLAGSRRMRGLWLSAAAVALALVPTASSRGGALAVITMLACAAPIWLARSSLTRRQRLLVAVGALLAAITVVSLDPRLRGLALHGQWNSLAAESNRQHAAMFQAGWLMGCTRPLIGYGPGTIPRVYPHFRARLNGGTDNVLQLHNAPAQIWAELGLPGVVALILILIGLAQRGRGVLHALGVASPTKSKTQPSPSLSPGPQDPDGATTGGTPVPLPADPVPATAVLIAFAGYAVMSLFDFQLDVPWFAAMVAALLVLLQVNSGAHAQATGVAVLSGPAARLAGALLLTGLATLLWPTIQEVRARRLFAEAADARQAGDDAAFVAGAERATAVAPGEPFYPAQLAGFFGEQFLRSNNLADRDRARERCSEQFRRTLAIDPDQDYCHFNLGWLLLPQEPAEAEKHFRASARLSPYRGGVYLGVGLSLLSRNDDAAATAFALEWLNDPHTLGSPLWDDPALSTMRTRAAAAVQRLADRWLEQEALPAADRDRIRYVAALTNWWLGLSPDTAALIRNGSPEQRHFFQHLESIEQRSFMPAESGVPEPWEALYLAWRTQTVPAAMDAHQPAFASSLRQRIIACQTSFARLLTLPVAPDAGLVRLGRNERPGYSVLMRNQDGFPVRDLYIYPENLLVEKYLSFLFPPKGLLPDRLLLAALRDLSAAPR